MSRRRGVGNAAGLRERAGRVSIVLGTAAATAFPAGCSSGSGGERDATDVFRADASGDESELSDVEAGASDGGGVDEVEIGETIEQADGGGDAGDAGVAEIDAEDGAAGDVAVGGDAGSDPDASLGPIWRPAPGTTWQWQLTGILDLSVDVEMYDVDLFDVTDSDIASLQRAGRTLICYFSAGSAEDWRPDYGRYPASALGDPLDGWPGERWVDVRDPEVRAILAERLDLARERGCDGVEPDNVDGYANDNGIGFTERDQVDFNRWLAGEAHSRGLSVGLKNALDLVDELLGDFDWALNEECVEWEECELLHPFLGAGLAVFHVEYVDRPGQGASRREAVCGDGTREGFSTLIKTWDLDAWRLDCGL